MKLFCKFFCTSLQCLINTGRILAACLSHIRTATAAAADKLSHCFDQIAGMCALLHGTVCCHSKKANRPVKILNLFAYTGGATCAAAKAGAHVTHVDASKGMVGWAKENAKLSGLPETSVRWIVDDCQKFVEREIRRGNHYDAIIMDPPSYGRGPKGEIWKIETSIYPFIQLCEKLLSDNPLFFLVNSYTTGLQPAVLTYMLSTAVKANHGGHVIADEVGLPVSGNGLVLPCGASGRWEH